MAVNGYDIDVSACRGVLTAVEQESGSILAARRGLSAHIDEAIAACSSAQIGGALVDLWNEVLALQCEAAATRVDNAVGGVHQALDAYITGDQVMADAGSRQVSAMPDIVIPDGKQ